MTTEQTVALYSAMSSKSHVLVHPMQCMARRVCQRSNISFHGNIPQHVLSSKLGELGSERKITRCIIIQQRLEKPRNDRHLLYHRAQLCFLFSTCLTCRLLPQETGPSYGNQILWLMSSGSMWVSHPMIRLHLDPNSDLQTCSGSTTMGPSKVRLLEPGKTREAEV